MIETKEHPTRTMLVKAPIDVLIAPLVQAVNNYPEALTMYSCQGEPCDNNNGSGWMFDHMAYLVFRVGRGTVQELATFLDFLGDHIEKVKKYIHLTIHLGCSGKFQLELRTYQENLSSCVEWLDAIRPHWQGLILEMRARCIASHRALIRSTINGSQDEHNHQEQEDQHARGSSPARAEAGTRP